MNDEGSARPADRAGRFLSIAAIVALGAVGLLSPDSVLLGGVAWLAFLFFVLSGWGWLVVRVLRVEDPDFGLRAAWGIAAYLAVTGIPLVLGVCSRPIILVAVAIGVFGFAWRELITPVPISRALRGGWAFARERPVIAYLAVLISIAVIFQIVGAIVHLDRNPWDDDVAYTAFVKRMLDTGDLIEPFSFRRLAAYGGQTLLQALVGSRGNIANVHALDHGLCYGLVFLLVIGHARSVRTSGFWLAIVVLAVLLLPDTSINTASYWSGAVLFIALYRSVANGQYTVAAVVAAATCTLRMNYIPVVILFLALALLSQLQRAARDSSWREAWMSQRGIWLRTIGVAVAILLPWCLAAFISSRTFLFPIVKGTWNHGLTLGTSSWTWVDELSLYVSAAIDSEPIVIVLLLAPLIAFATDNRLTRPLPALFIASAIGFGLLVHSFTDADVATLWRYAFGYGLTLFVVFALEASDESDGGPVRLPTIGRWVLVVAMLVQLAATRTGQVKRYAAIAVDIREAAAIDRRGDPSVRVEHRRYADAQAVVPAGARLAVMVDDPAFFDFSRNRIANLDTPGYASPGTQMPSFTGAEAMRAYLLDSGYRYLAFVREDRSRYVFRRGFWIWRMFNDAEFFQAMSAYMIDTIESFAELAGSSTVLYDADGLVVLDLEQPHSPARELDPAHEADRRDAFTQELAKREHLEREWALTTRRDLVFADGYSGLTFAQADADAHWFDFFVRDPKPTRGVPTRFMHRRAHIRLRGDADMHLVLRGHVNLNMLYTHPRLDVSLDGALLTSMTVDDTGAFVIDAVVPKAQLDGWCDLYVVFNTTGIQDLRYARLEEATWEPR